MYCMARHFVLLVRLAMRVSEHSRLTAQEGGGGGMDRIDGKLEGKNKRGREEKGLCLVARRSTYCAELLYLNSVASIRTPS